MWREGVHTQGVPLLYAVRSGVGVETFPTTKVMMCDVPLVQRTQSVAENRWVQNGCGLENRHSRHDIHAIHVNVHSHLDVLDVYLFLKENLVKGLVTWSH